MTKHFIYESDNSKDTFLKSNSYEKLEGDIN